MVLSTVALLLVRESRSLLVGENVDLEIMKGIRAVAEADPAVAEVVDPIAMHLGPRQVLLNMGMRFKPSVSAEALPETVERIEESIRRKYPIVKRIYIEAESIRVPAGRVSGGTIGSPCPRNQPSPQGHAAPRPIVEGGALGNAAPKGNAAK